MQGAQINNNIRRALLYFVFLSHSVGVVLGQAKPRDLENELQKLLLAVPATQRPAVLRAIHADANGDYRSALNELQPIANSGKASPIVYLVLGDAYQKTKDLPAAERSIRRAIELLGAQVNSVPWNLRFKLAEVLYANGDYSGAVRQSEKALGYPNLSKDDTSILVVLGDSYLGLGNVGAARTAYLCALSRDSGDPSIWDKLVDSRLSPMHTASGDRVGSGRTPCDLQGVPVEGVLALGPPSGWTKEKSSEGQAAYVAFGDALFRRGNAPACFNYLRVAVAAHFRALGSQDAAHDSALFVQSLEAIQPLESLDAGLHRQLLVGLVEEEMAEDDYLHVAKNLEGVCNIDYSQSNIAAVRPENARMLNIVSRKLFSAISFSSKDGVPRYSDPDDFFPGPPSSDPVVQRNYGMVSDSEDWADTFAAVIMKKVPIADGKGGFPEVDVAKILSARLESQKFDLPVKVIVYEQALGIKHDFKSGNVAGMLLSDLDSAIQKADNDKIHPFTLVAYVAARKIDSLMGNCPK